LPQSWVTNIRRSVCRLVSIYCLNIVYFLTTRQTVFKHIYILIDVKQLDITFVFVFTNLWFFVCFLTMICQTVFKHIHRVYNV
jgi:hypothetical protein